MSEAGLPEERTSGATRFTGIPFPALRPAPGSHPGCRPRRRDGTKARAKEGFPAGLAAQSTQARDPTQNFSGFEFRARARQIRGCGRALAGRRRGESSSQLRGRGEGGPDPGASGRAAWGWGLGRDDERASPGSTWAGGRCGGRRRGARSLACPAAASSPGWPGWRLLRLPPSCFSWQPLRGS